jgi:hypothetical protein
MMREACLGPRRVVMAGGSAGAIWWVLIFYFLRSDVLGS